jgi:hypothetical protein
MRRTAPAVDRALGRLFSTSAEADRVWHHLADAPRASRSPRPQLEELIAEFLNEAMDERPRTELRELRSALLHISSELGTMSVEDVRAWDVRGFADRLHAAGLPAARLDAVMEAFRELYVYAERRRLVEKSPVPTVILLGQGQRADRQAGGVQTPTDAMLALGTQVANWTGRLVLIGFVVVVFVFARELGIIDSIPFS